MVTNRCRSNVPMVECFTCFITICSVSDAQSFSVQGDPGVMSSVLRHRLQRKRVRSIVRDDEDSRGIVVTVTNVTDDVVKQQRVSRIERNMSGDLNAEGDVWIGT